MVIMKFFLRLLGMNVQGVSNEQTPWTLNNSEEKHSVKDR